MAEVPGRALDLIRTYCEEKTPPGMRDRMRLVVDVDGTAGTISDSRPPWDGRPGPWTMEPIAQLRFKLRAKEWVLYWPDSDDRWHRYVELDPTTNLDAVLAEIEADPTYVFWG